MPEDYEEILLLTPWRRNSKTIKNARKKLETPVAPALLCKKNKNGETRSKSNDFNSKFACVLEASESIRLRMEESLPTYHDDYVRGKGDNSLQHYSLVHKFILIPQTMKIPAVNKCSSGKI